MQFNGRICDCGSREEGSTPSFRLYNIKKEAKMNIIFICRHNSFRSRIAEAYFKSINKNKKIKAISGGLIKGLSPSNNQLKAMKEQGIRLISKPKNISANMLAKQDLTIITADDISISLFDNKNYNKKVIQWKIPDVLDNNKEKANKTITLIKYKVQQLVNDLENKK